MSDSQRDAVIIGCENAAFRECITCFRYANPLMKSGGIIFVDNFCPCEEMPFSHLVNFVDVFGSVGP